MAKIWYLTLSERSLTSFNSEDKPYFREPNVKSYNKVDFYFTHAYSPHERGTNERINRDIHGFIPKGIKFETITDEELLDINDNLLNGQFDRQNKNEVWVNCH